MSEGNKRADALMARINSLGASIYNPIYEAVSVLSDRQAKRLVDAIRSIMAGSRADGGGDE